MAQKLLSPGVFTNELDQSFLAQGVAGIGAAVVGRSSKGPAFQNVKVPNFNDFVAKLGDLNYKMQASYAAKNYLKNSTSLNFVRVLGHSDGTDAVPGYSVGGVTGIVDGTGSDAKVLAVIHHSGTVSEVSVAGVSGDANKFVFSVGSFSATASFLTSSADYIEKVLNTDPTRYSTDNHYLYQTFKYAKPATSSSWNAVAVSGALTSFEKNYHGGSTPWIKSQPLGGNEYELFKLHTLGDGRSSNDDIKVSIQNIKPSANPNANPWGTFDVYVRKFYDTDIRPSVLETFVGLSLNPSDRNYILRRIGDSFESFDTVTRKFVASGSFPSKSSYIRVEMNEGSGAPPEALPWGHKGYHKLKYSVSNKDGGGVAHTIPSLSYRETQKDKDGNHNANFYWGPLFVSGGIVDRMRAFPELNADQESDFLTQDTDFSLKHLSGTYTNGAFRYSYNTNVSNYTPTFISASLQKFTVPFQGGFDGFDLRVDNPLEISNSAGNTDIGVVSLKRALDTIADPDFVDINLLTIPGVHNLKVCDHARNIVNERRDVLYIMDITGSTVTEAIENLKNREIDDNYTAVYYPDVKVDDEISNRIVRLAPSAVVIGAYAYSDRSSQVWFAPAGMNRGGLDAFGVVDIVDRVDYKDRDNLYNNRINPIASFPNEGITVFGQKTLQANESALDRVNVRRLLIFAKKTIASAAKYLVFEPSDPTTYQAFTKTVNPILEDVRLKRGLEKFKVVMDTNINTPDVVDQNIIKGKVFLQPTKAAEFIDLQFIITSSGVVFSE